jgi:hypothetical protein
MLNKLKDLSSVILIPTACLYLFGFVCLTAYYARFGIISYDIVNARFIIAGFFPLISLGGAFILSWYLYRIIPREVLYSKTPVAGSTLRKRCVGYLWFLFYTWGLSTCLTLFFNLGEFIPPSDPSVLIFHSLGQYDFVGRMIEQINVSAFPGDPVFVIQYTLLIFIYVMILSIIVFVVLKTYEQIQLRRVKPAPQATTLAAAQPAENVAVVSGQTGAPAKRNNLIMLSRYAIEMLFVVLFLGIMIWAGLKLKVEAFDFQSFNSPLTLTTDMVFAWVYDSAIFFYLALVWIGRSPDQITSDLFKFQNPLMFSDAFQQLIVPIVIGLFAFGATVFPRIPFAIGGGQPREIDLKTTLNPDPFFGKKLFMIGESSQYLFIVELEEQETAAFQINKENIEYVKTRRPTPTDHQ